MSLTITELDQKARDYLTLSGRMRQRGLDADELRVLAYLYIAHEPVACSKLHEAVGISRVDLDSLKWRNLVKLTIEPAKRVCAITRRGRELLAEVLAS